MSHPVSLDEINQGEWVAASAWMQYTGLHDKNGKEICEGDILAGPSIEASKVRFVDGGFFAGSMELYQIVSGYYGYCEIIGNIYENSGLLGSGARED
jgi:hypothetical protein